MVRGEPRHVAAYAKDFLFRDAQLRQPVASLSGGERNRLLLARALAKPANLLVLDEPTNDLDMDTLDLLEDLLADYEGTLILVSHDRDFIDRLATSTIALDGRGRAVETPGGWSDFIAQNPGFFDAPELRTRQGAPQAAPPAPRKRGRGPSSPTRTSGGWRSWRPVADACRQIAALEAGSRRRRPLWPRSQRLRRPDHGRSRQPEGAAPQGRRLWPGQVSEESARWLDAGTEKTARRALQGACDPGQTSETRRDGTGLG